MVFGCEMRGCDPRLELPNSLQLKLIVAGFELKT